MTIHQQTRRALGARRNSMDDIDRAEAQSAEFLRRRIDEERSKTSVIPATGYCLNCDTALPDGRRWCDAECRNDFEKYVSRR